MKSIEKEYPKVKIIGYSCPPFLSFEELAEQKYFDEIIKLNPDIVWFSLDFQSKKNYKIS